MKAFSNVLRIAGLDQREKDEHDYNFYLPLRSTDIDINEIDLHAPGADDINWAMLQWRLFP